MALQTTALLRAGQVLEITFPTFKPRITIDSDHQLTVEIIAGEKDPQGILCKRSSFVLAGCFSS